MTWDEFSELLSGLSPDSPLGRIVQIRLETDKEILKHFTPSQRKIKAQWQNRQAKAVSPEKLNEALESFKQAFINMT